MIIDFPYPGYEQIQPAEVPQQNLMGVFAPRLPHPLDEPRVVRDGFDHPIGAARFNDAVRGHKRVLILIDDGTRRTPTARILPTLIDELHAGGIEDRNIEFLQAPGTHRPMKPDELREKLGTFFGKYRVHEHHYKDQKSLHAFGHTSDGTRASPQTSC